MDHARRVLPRGRMHHPAHATAINVISAGKVCESGTHEELVEKEGGVYAGLLALQRRKKNETISEARD